MAWVNVGNELETDGAAFAEPIDSFERLFNAKLAAGGPEAVHPDVISMQRGWPLSTRMMDEKPEGSDDTRNLLDFFFDGHTQDMAADNGNTPGEMDELAKKGLTWAAYFGTPITDSERNVATRLGVKVEQLPRLEDNRARQHRMGF